MLKVHIAGREQAIVVGDGDSLPDKATWYDLHDPDAEEVRAVEQAIGVQLPRREQISGIGLPSHRRSDEKAVHLHMALYSDSNGEPDKVPTGVVATSDALVTMRFGCCGIIDEAAERVREDPQATAVGAFLTLLEMVTNQVAEQMQQIANGVGDLSAHIFVEQRLRTRELHRLMLRVGALESRLARYRTSLLGIARMVDFVNHRPPPWISKSVLERLDVVDNDLETLDKFDEQLTSKLQFLLDAILGFINTAQNDVMKLLTVASVVTIPPIILAAIWGMNFRHMPELDPVWGYPMALVLIVVSIAVPLGWFYRRGWLVQGRPKAKSSRVKDASGAS
ncbi:MAG TPA: CorA family divalent cation transporter [Rhodanobacteraceae bacterium]|nr:CorA family divalent cation transporter [Rhodanobacteraceae bacterium]